MLNRSDACTLCDEETYGTLGGPSIWMTCGLRKYKASFEQRKTDGEGIRVARKVEELMMSDV
jgi:hypothetical protein